jgi:hypothetical protein
MIAPVWSLGLRSGAGDLIRSASEAGPKVRTIMKITKKSGEGKNNNTFP